MPLDPDDLARLRAICEGKLAVSKSDLVYAELPGGVYKKGQLIEVEPKPLPPAKQKFGGKKVPWRQVTEWEKLEPILSEEWMDFKRLTELSGSKRVALDGIKYGRSRGLVEERTVLATKPSGPVYRKSEYRRKILRG